MTDHRNRITERLEDGTEVIRVRTRWTGVELSKVAGSEQSFLFCQLFALQREFKPQSVTQS